MDYVTKVFFFSFGDYRVFFLLLLLFLLSYTNPEICPPPFPPGSFALPSLSSQVISPFHFRKGQASEGCQSNMTYQVAVRAGPSPTYLVWMGQPSRRKRVPKTGKRVRNSSCSHHRELYKKTKLHNHSIDAEELGRPIQTPWLLVQSL